MTNLKPPPLLKYIAWYDLLLKNWDISIQSFQNLLLFFIILRTYYCNTMSEQFFTKPVPSEAETNQIKTSLKNICPMLRFSEWMNGVWFVVLSLCRYYIKTKLWKFPRTMQNIKFKENIIFTANIKFKLKLLVNCSQIVF